MRAAIGGPGLIAQMRELDPDRVDELVDVYRAHNEPLHATLEAFDGVLELLPELRRARPPARDRDGEARRDRRSSRSSASRCSRELTDVLVGAEDTERHKPDPDPCSRRSRRLGATPGRGRLRRRLAVRHPGRQGRRRARDRRRLGRHPPRRAAPRRGARRARPASGGDPRARLTPRPRGRGAAAARRAPRATATTSSTTRRSPTPAYDALYDELQALEEAHPELVTPDSPTQRVGAPPGGAASRKVEHLAPMGSLEKVTTREALEKWADDVRKRLGTDEPVAYVIEPKIDGSAISLVYEDGVLVRGGDPRRRHPGRGRDREPAHDRGGAAAHAVRTTSRRRRCSRCAARSTSRSPASPASTSAGRGRQEAGAEPAQRCGGLAAAAEPGDHRRAAALGLGLRRRRARGRSSSTRSSRCSRWLREHGFRTNPHAERLETIEEVAAACERLGEPARPSSTTRSTGS